MRRGERDNMNARNSLKAKGKDTKQGGKIKRRMVTGIKKLRCLMIRRNSRRVRKEEGDNMNVRNSCLKAKNKA